MFEPTPPTIDPDALPTPTWKSRLLTGVAGGALGYGVGFLASLVARGDWNAGEGKNIIRGAFNATQAPARWGTGHTHGVIQVVTLGQG
jgi:hypothetical protein